MELEDKYEILLLGIHESEGERFLKSEISKKGKLEEIEILLDYLIEIELVEFDKKDNAFYLTYEGYGKVEEIKEMSGVGQAMADLEYEHVRNRERKNRIRLFVLGLFILIGGYFALNGIRMSNNVKNELDEEMLKMIKETIETKTDSILKAKEIELQENDH